MKQLIQDLINKGNLSSQDIDVSLTVKIDYDKWSIFFLKVLKKLIEQLDQTKADKIFVNHELDKVNILKWNIKFFNFFYFIFLESWQTRSWKSSFKKRF